MPGMSAPPGKEILRDAKLIEDLRAQRIRWRYAALSKKIAAYSEGVGEPPTPEEFATWIEDGKDIQRIAVSQAKRLVRP